MKNPDISFIVTCYNFEKYIGKAIQSILDQQGEYNFEIIVIDDASPDQSASVIAAFSDERIRFIRHESNKGSSFSVNEGFQLAKGNFIARLDGDDYYYPDFLEQTIPVFSEFSDVGLVYGDYTSINENNEVTGLHCKPSRGSLPEYGNEFTSILRNYYITAPTIIARREAWLLGLPVPAEFSFLDWYLSLSVMTVWKSFYISRQLAYYRIHSANMHRTMIHDRKGEMITAAVLDTFTKKGTELKLLDAQSVKGIYYDNYVVLGLKYFGSEMDDDASRCFKKALTYNPVRFISGKNMLYLFVSFFGIKRYNRLKALIFK